LDNVTALAWRRDVTAYNARVEAAFEARRIIAWPFTGAITIEEVSKDKKLREVFAIGQLVFDCE